MKFALIFIACIIGLYIYTQQSQRENFVKLNYVITNTKAPNSFDPLDGDKTANLTEMRMLYATPIEISRNNTLISNVLKSFNYNPQTFEITFEVNEGLVYSDGTALTPRDVILSITRMAHARPTFPVIKDILGLQEWINSKNGLTTVPIGIVVNNNIIKIQLTIPHLNPLFRFCLELFSIIPEKCIDLNTSKMTCGRAPSSGYFTLDDKNISEERMVFFKRKNINNTAEEIQYDEITFIFNNLKSICNKSIEENTIIVGTETDFLKSECDKKLSKDQIYWTPAVKFSAMLFNPNVNIFNSPQKRLYFATHVRASINQNYPELFVSESFFSPLLPGYLESSKFEKIIYDDGIEQSFKGKSIAMIKNINTVTTLAIENVAKKLGMNITYIENSSDDYLDKAFLNGELQIDTSNSGFWAMDPVGDLSMYLTPKLHASLVHIWKDDKTYELLKKIENEQDSTQLKTQLENFNLYLYSNSLIAPAVHFKKLYITNSSNKNLNLPQAVTSPAPWQILPL